MNGCGELSTRCCESSEILPFGPPRSTGGRWAKISPLSVPLWITLEQALPLSKRVRKNEGKSQRFG